HRFWRVRQLPRAPARRRRQRPRPRERRAPGRASRDGRLGGGAPDEDRWWVRRAAPSRRARAAMTGEASRTALATTLMRALHTRFDRPALLDDPWGERLVTEAEQEGLLRRYLESVAPAQRAALDRLDSRAAKLHAIMRRSPFYGGVIVRSRYAEEML